MSACHADESEFLRFELISSPLVFFFFFVENRDREKKMMIAKKSRKLSFHLDFLYIGCLNLVHKFLINLRLRAIILAVLQWTNLISLGATF